jgi:hypothetical protein
MVHLEDGICPASNSLGGWGMIRFVKLLEQIFKNLIVLKIKHVVCSGFVDLDCPPSR